MCGIVGFVDKLGHRDGTTGRAVLAMLEALGCRGPDSAGVALLREEPAEAGWTVRVAPAGAASALGALASLGCVAAVERQGDTVRFTLRPEPGVTADAVEAALGACRG